MSRGPLFAKDPPDLRPLSSRTLKSAMDTLRPHLTGARVLDLFAGQGRFGLSVLEEGAEIAVFVEKDRKTAALLKKHAERWADRAKVLAQDSFAYLESPGEPFDIVFADPPFRMWSSTFHGRLFTSVQGCLKVGSIFLVKHPKRVLPSPPPTPRFVLEKTTVFGESQLIYFRYGNEKD